MGEFKISTNIDRDVNHEINYIVTQNSNEVYERILYASNRGQRAFSIIGSYGTGKSTFLWAFEKHLSGKRYFNSQEGVLLKGIKSYDFVRVVGEGVSFKEKFCETFGLLKWKEATNKKILKEFSLLCDEIAAKKRGLVLLVDEFGKHLEFVAKTNPDELFFIQELAEFCNDENRKVNLITTLHQNFSVYSKGLSKAQRSEWDKVRGRFIDIAFDEPVEQLLFFAAESLKDHKVPSSFKKTFDSGVQSILKSNLLGKAVKLNISRLEHLYPLDPLSADILTKSLQRYGQNERSLFTFLNSTELKSKLSNSISFNVADCFDYLVSNLTTEIEDGEKNPFKPQWKAAIVALEKAEIAFDAEYSDVAKIIKTICLVNIFSNSAGTLDESVLAEYSNAFLEIDNSVNLIKKLVSGRFIKYSSHRSKYNFIDGTDVDIEQELIDANKYVDAEFDLLTRLESYIDLPIMPAKMAQFEMGTPRFFSFKFFNAIPQILSEPVAEIDGYINVILSNKRLEGELREFAQTVSPAHVFVLFSEVDELREQIFTVEKINYVIRKYADDRVAVRILNEEKFYRQNEIKRLIENALFGSNNGSKWIWNTKIDTGIVEKRKIKSLRSLNRLISDAAMVAYPYTPCYKNEMVNKEFLSAPINTARKALIKQMIENGDKADIGFEPNLFPPEKTIYLSLLQNTGVHRLINKFHRFDAPTELSFSPLWNKCEEILKESMHAKIPVSDFYKVLSQGEFKLKKGFLDFWIPIYLVIKKEDYSLYSEDGEYVPLLNTDIMDLIYKQPGKFYLKALSRSGINNEYLNFYKELVGYNESNIKGLKTSYVTIYGNFLRFYRGLDDYSKKTKNLSPQAIGVRNAIANASDPESALFVQIPEALGYYGLTSGDKRMSSFLTDLQDSIRQLRSAYDQLVDSVQRSVMDHLMLKDGDFDSVKMQLLNRFSGINKNLILNENIKLFYSRVVSPLDVRNAYWEALCDATLSKKLDKLKDEEVVILIDRMKANFDGLIHLAELHELSVDSDEDVFQVVITNQNGNEDVKKNIFFKKNLQSKSKAILNELEKKLSDDNELNKFVVINLLRKLLEK